jgi:hypothetical protein
VYFTLSSISNEVLIQELHGLDLNINISKVRTNADRVANINLFTREAFSTSTTNSINEWPVCGTSGNLLAWDILSSNYVTSKWHWDHRFLPNLVRFNKVSINTVCRSLSVNNPSKEVMKNRIQQPYLVTDLLERNFDEAKDRCEKLGNEGQLYSFATASDYQATWPRVVQHGIFDEMWTAYHRSLTSLQSFVNIYDSEEAIPAGLWGAGQPNNIDQQCVVCSKLADCLDQFCTTPKPSVCQFSTRGAPFLRLRGNCAKSALDTLYYPSSDQSSEFMWIGIKSTFIKYNQTSRQWEAHVAHGDDEPNTWAYTEADVEGMLLGTNFWTVVEDRACYPGPSRAVTMSLSSCQSQEFNCDNGDCTHLDNRCDGLFDCSDGSDEKDCYYLDALDNYNKDISPSTDRENVEQLGRACIKQFLHHYIFYYNYLFRIQIKKAS